MNNMATVGGIIGSIVKNMATVGGIIGSIVSMQHGDSWQGVNNMATGGVRE